MIDLILRPDQQMPFRQLEAFLGQPVTDLFEFEYGTLNDLRLPFEDIKGMGGTSYVIVDNGYVVGLTLMGGQDYLLGFEAEDNVFHRVNAFIADNPDWLRPLHALIHYNALSVRQSVLDLSHHPHLLDFNFDDNYTKKIRCTAWQKKHFRFDRKADWKVVSEAKPALSGKLQKHLYLLRLEVSDEWDEFDPAEAMKLISDPECDLGTVLHIYWYGMPYDQLSQKTANQLKAREYVSWNGKWIPVLEQIRKNVTDSFYETALLPFDPGLDQPAYGCYEPHGPLAYAIPAELNQVIESGYLELLQTEDS